MRGFGCRLGIVDERKAVYFRGVEIGYQTLRIRSLCEEQALLSLNSECVRLASSKDASLTFDPLSMSRTLHPASGRRAPRIRIRCLSWRSMMVALNSNWPLGMRRPHH